MKKIIAYKGYYVEFMSKLSEQERKKIQRALLLFETEDKKKTQKTPKSEIDKAVRLKNEYYENK